MDIMEFGAIGEASGGFAVLVTLIYLAVQVRQRGAAQWWSEMKFLWAPEFVDRVDTLLRQSDDVPVLTERVSWYLDDAIAAEGGA